MIVKCIFTKRYCRKCYFGIDWLEAPITCDMDFTKPCRECESCETHPVTVCKNFSAIQIAPNFITIDDMDISTEDIIELWVDYGDGKGMTKQIVNR